MKPANNSGPTDRVLDEGLEVEAVAQRLGITEEAVRRICRDHEQEILRIMRDSAGDLIFALAHHEGLVTLGEPEIPEAVIAACDNLDLLSLAKSTHAKALAKLESDSSALEEPFEGLTVRSLIDAGWVIPCEIRLIDTDEEPVS